MVKDAAAAAGGNWTKPWDVYIRSRCGGSWMQLLEKDRNLGLSKEEKLELQQLMQDLARPP